MEQPASEASTISRRAQKRQEKAVALKTLRIEKRKEQKAHLADLKAKRRAGELPDDIEIPKRKKRKGSAPAGQKVPFGARVVIDLGFDDKMLDKEINSMISQLAYTYNANRKTLRPFSSLLVTSLNGRTRERLESLGDAAYKRWNAVEWWKESYELLWTEEASHESFRCSKDSVVYLTADADDELHELQEHETYIIGGLCDHNRYKNLCLNKAKTHGIRAAKLPIGKYIANMPSRKVLTVNQVCGGDGNALISTYCARPRCLTFCFVGWSIETGKNHYMLSFRSGSFV